MLSCYHRISILGVYYRLGNVTLTSQGPIGSEKWISFPGTAQTSTPVAAYQYCFIGTGTFVLTDIDAKAKLSITSHAAYYPFITAAPAIHYCMRTSTLGGTEIPCFGNSQTSIPGGKYRHVDHIGARTLYYSDAGADCIVLTIYGLSIQPYYWAHSDIHAPGLTRSSVTVFGSPVAADCNTFYLGDTSTLDCIGPLPITIPSASYSE